MKLQGNVAFGEIQKWIEFQENILHNCDSDIFFIFFHSK